MGKSHSPVHWKSAAEIVELVKSKQISPREVVESTIDLIEQRDPGLNAVVYKAYDEAREKAAALERRIMQGEPVGMLAGVPTLMKDLFAAKPGWPYTLGGIRALKDARGAAGVWSTYPLKMSGEDSLLLGQTNSPVYGFRGTTDNTFFGPTRNPFNLDFNAGGSSGGAAALVADGIVPVAGGTDGGGSIRIPAAWTNTYGFQPSIGRVPFKSRPNAFHPGPYLYEGPITRTVRDAALAMNVLHGFDRRDPASLRVKLDFTSALAQGVRGKKIGLTLNYGVFPVQQEIQDLIGKAARVFTELGAHVEFVDLGIPYSQKQMSDAWCRMVAIPTAASMQALRKEGIDLYGEHRADIPDALMKWIDAVADISVQQISADQLLRTTVFDCMNGVFDRFDLLLAPTLACMPVRNATDGCTEGPSQINGEEIDPLIGWCMTYLTNFSGHPSASVPAGLIDGLPAGMLIIGDRQADLDVIAASAAFERASPWSQYYDIPAGRPL
ncbi:amidase [Pseudomonas aeruginosa]|uniref:Amidase n=1 Tax=Pseudomonas aeruginosa TaxID=287 RepID=A0A844NUK1_PSEAI|nr:amidase [Pseudomonas aeruginosa]MUH94546.1 amidase [Pseudomonas aeruginosa]MUI39629.1 amidase [Pseudomonas aeruginosa]HCF3643311.1 amidase [Pseudomonas aeruginosa]